MRALPKSLNLSLQQLSIIPSVVFIILLSAVLIGLYNNELNRLEQETGKLAIHWLIKNNDPQLSSLPQQQAQLQAQQAVDALISSYKIRSAVLLNGDKQIIASAGAVPPDHILHTMLSSNRAFNTYDNQQLISEPVYAADHQTIIGWGIISINRQFGVLLHYQGLTATLVGLLLALTILAALAWRLTRKLHQPLQHIQSTIEAFNSGKLQQRAPIEGCLELQRLAREVNALGQQLEVARLDVQEQIQEATDDLHETLEAIEVKNVELDMARKEALRASQIKSEFLANTSHEIRTPINGIIGFTSLLQKTQLTSQQQEYLRTIAHSSQGLLTIINDILDFSRMESGKLTLDHAPLDLRYVIEETLQIVAPSAHSKGQQLISLIDHAMPLQFMGDALRIKQVLSNLVSNATKFSGRGNIIVRAQLIEQKDNKALIKISVSDSGIGLSKEQQARLFKAFTQLDTADNREQGGTGLGLAIAKGLIERMGGTIGVDSAPGEGATFWFTTLLNTAKTTSEHHHTALANKRIGVLENNPISQLQISHLLEGWQAEIIDIDIDTDIPQSLQTAQSAGQPLDAIILGTAADDDVNRAEYLRHLVQLSQNHWQCPVIILTLPETLYDQHPGLAAAAAEIIAKPICHDRLYEALCQHIGLKEEPNTQLGTPATAISHAPKPKILAVDDNPANLQLVCEFLQGLGVQVTRANSGQEALNHCQRQRFDLIFMDVQMPGLDGMETTRQLRAMENNAYRTPVIALTAHAMHEQKSELLLAGMDDYTSKPVSEAQLAHLLNRWVHTYPETVRPEITNPETTNPKTASASTATGNANMAKGIAMGSSIEHPLPAAPDTTSMFEIMDLSEALRLSNQKHLLAKDMLSALLQDLPDSEQQIRTLLQQQHWQALEHVVHRLHGGCCYCGVPELRNISAIVDGLLQKQFYTELEQPVGKLLESIKRLQQWSDEHDLDSLFSEETDCD